MIVRLYNNCVVNSELKYIEPFTMNAFIAHARRPNEQHWLNGISRKVFHKNHSGYTKPSSNIGKVK